jgi:hypothetical protein
MVGRDRDDEGLIDIHSENVANSQSLANMMEDVNEHYSIGLITEIYNPGVTASDHSPFWDIGVGAIAFSQAFYGGDMTPHYHKSSDRISEFNMPYFLKLSKLGVGAIVTLANPYEPGALDIHLMEAGTITLTGCDGILYDDGGASANYGDQNDYIVSIVPDSAIEVSIVFESFDVEEGSGNGVNPCNYDWLRIYDGGSTSSLELATYCNNAPPIISESINTSTGAITLELHADQLENRAGFKLEWSCKTSTVTGISEKESSDDTWVKAYPNPIEDHLTLGTRNTQRVEIWSEAGKMIFSKHVVDEEFDIDFSSLPTGTYSLRCIGESGQYATFLFKR